MNKPSRNFLALLATVAVVVAGYFAWSAWTQRGAGPAPPAPPAFKVAGAEPVGVPPREAVPEDDTTKLLHATAVTLRAGGGADAARRSLAAFKSHLSSLPRSTAVAAIRASLDSGADAPSGLGFVVAPGGGLAEAPSLRVFLLDTLAEVDANAAAEYARKILSAMNSPEEWAVALRNVARVQTDEAGRAFLEEKMRALLTHEPWIGASSAGFLEAFDVAVSLRGTNLVGELASLVRRTEQRPSAHAAYLALDRLTIADPAPLLAKLAEEPDLMRGREATRANYFARADVGDAAQRAVVERYLLEARRTPEELRTFAGLYPHANFMISQNLLTRVVTPDRAELAARDQTALRVVNEWLADARFSTLRPQLEKIRARLETFVGQAGR